MNSINKPMNDKSSKAITTPYGIQVNGDTMSPRFKDGEIVIVDPALRAKKGDDVVVQIVNKDNPECGPIAYVKTLVSLDTDKLKLSQYLPEKELVFESSEVLAVHPITEMRR
jgi:phage repressor protein C with HTH and peptisase S24 domain